jgi:RNA recognition motif-containing protein
MKNLYVGNLPHNTTETDLRNAFAVYGQVDNVNIITDRDTGRARGFAFVEMGDSTGAEKAIAASMDPTWVAAPFRSTRPGPKLNAREEVAGSGLVLDGPAVNATAVKGLVSLANRAGNSRSLRKL